jgi:hypothetical protein
MRFTEPTLLPAFRCHRRQTRIMRRGRLLVAGDAAHIHSPAGGQGMNTGLHDAFNLGWKLALVAARTSPPQLLDTYQDERLPIAAGVLEFTHGLVRLFTLASPRERWLRDRLLPIAMSFPAAERRYTRRLAQISHNYRRAPLAHAATRRGSKTIAAGDRLPSVSGLTRYGQQISTLDLLDSTAHTLLLLTGQHGGMEAAQTAVARLARFSGAVQIVTVRGPAGELDRNVVGDPHLNAHRRYHAQHGALLLVRPDGYIACHASLNRADIPQRYLQELTTQATAGPHTARPLTPGCGIAHPIG